MIYTAEGNAVNEQCLVKWTLIRDREGAPAQKEPFAESMPAQKEPFAESMPAQKESI
jgi:hypothetical protein